MNQYDTEYTFEPVCPHCGEKERDAWEIDFGNGTDGDTTITCGSCDKDYLCTRNVNVSYSTGIIKDKNKIQTSFNKISSEIHDIHTGKAKVKDMVFEKNGSHISVTAQNKS